MQSFFKENEFPNDINGLHTIFFLANNNKNHFFLKKQSSCNKNKKKLKNKHNIDGEQIVTEEKAKEEIQETKTIVRRSRIPKRKIPSKKGTRPYRLPNNKNGRPEAYCQAIGDYICREITKGRTLTSICKEDKMPTIPTVYSWLSVLNKNYKPDFFKSYSLAKEIQMDVMADQLCEIADDAINDYMEKMRKDGTVEEVFNAEHVQRSRLRVDVRKWLMSKVAPKKYGDKIQLTGKDDKPLIPTEIILDFTVDDGNSTKDFDNKT